MPIDELYILHHTHVDVGYTDLQPAIYERHLDIIDQALDLCRASDDYPEAARFRWIHEFSWPVMRYLRERPARAPELLARLREGRMELCGLYLDPTELCDRRALQESLKPALRLSREQGLPPPCVMTTDIPGQPWSLADVMAEHGLSCLSVSPNAMVSKPIEVERPFYWVGPEGGKVLVWQTDWRNGWYGEGHSLGFPQGLEVARERVLAYLALLQSEAYPWRVLALHMGADNYPPFEGLSDLVAGWNEDTGLPRMRIATNREFFTRLLELHAGEFAAHQLAWPDWWANGVGSAAYETALSRETHCRLRRIEALQASLDDQTDLWPVFEDLLLFDEHTWGCSNMALKPYSFESRASWAFKSATIYRAVDAARRLEQGLVARAAAGSDLGVFNPSAHTHVGPVELGTLPDDVVALVSPERAAVPVQHSPATALGAGAAWAVLTTPPRAACTWRTSTQAPPPTADVGCRDGVLCNDFYRIRYDPETGCVLSIVEPATGRELLEPRERWRFAESIQERIRGTRDRCAIWEPHNRGVPNGTRRSRAPFARTGTGVRARMGATCEGGVFASVTSVSRLPGVRRVETEVRLWRGLRRIDVTVRMHKQPQEAYDSLYVAFPWALSTPRAFIHNAGAVFEAEAEQLAGTCRDFYAVEHFVAMQGDEGWAAVVPVDSPLVEVGAINTGSWRDHLELTGASVYAWVTNNFWYTNFPGYQLGILTFRFALTTGTGVAPLDELARFGEAVRVGLTVRER